MLQPLHPDELQSTAVITDVKQRIECFYIPRNSPEFSGDHYFNLVFFSLLEQLYISVTENKVCSSQVNTKQRQICTLSDCGSAII